MPPDGKHTGVLARMRNWVLHRRGMYQEAFQSDAGQYVLGDLFHLCCAGCSTWNGNRDEMLIREGKRQVWIHITSMMNAKDEDLVALAEQHIRDQQGMIQE